MRRTVSARAREIESLATRVAREGAAHSKRQHRARSARAAVRALDGSRRGQRHRAHLGDRLRHGRPARHVSRARVERRLGGRLTRRSPGRPARGVRRARVRRPPPRGGRADRARRQARRRRRRRDAARAGHPQHIGGARLAADDVVWSGRGDAGRARRRRRRPAPAAVVCGRRRGRHAAARSPFLGRRTAGRTPGLSATRGRDRGAAARLRRAALHRVAARAAIAIAAARAVPRVVGGHRRGDRAGGARPARTRGARGGAARDSAASSLRSPRSR